MTSRRHTTAGPVAAGPTPDRSGRSSDDALLDAARATILTVGWRRTTLTDVARRAGVSRMTLYRRWPDMQTLLADLMTREWTAVAERSSPEVGEAAPERIAEGVAATVSGLRANELFARIVQVDPELLLPYLLDRRGRSQDAILARLEAAISAGQAVGSVRAGHPGRLARGVLLAAHGFTLSAQTMTEPTAGQATDGVADDIDVTDMTGLDGELRDLVDRYLRP
jgi:AcrR family transcriptional regulator